MNFKSWLILFGIVLLLAVSVHGVDENSVNVDESFVDDDIDNDDDNENNEETSRDYEADQQANSADADGAESNESVDYSSDALNDLNLDELEPSQTNCRLTFSLPSNRTRIAVFCSKIPRFCSNVCDTIKKVDFDEKIAAITPFSFASYRAKQSLELNFKSTLTRIDSDAFNGLVIEQDVTMRVNIVGSDDELNSKVLFSDYDQSGAKSKQQTLYVMPNAFRGVNVMEGGRLIVTIKNLNRIIFDSQSLIGLKQLADSSVIFNVERINDVIFKSKCAKSWQAYTKSNKNDDILIVDSNDYEDANGSTTKKQQQSKMSGNLVNRIEKYVSGILYKLNLNNVDTVVFETDSFSDLKQSKRSTFQINIANFVDAKFGKLSFNKLTQSQLSSFELNLKSGKRVLISQSTFANINQAEKSKYSLFINVTDSSICLLSDAFANITQKPMSSFRLSANLNSNNNIIFQANSIKNVVQDFKSSFEVNIQKANGVKLESGSIGFVNQSRESTFEIMSTQTKSYFRVASNAIKQFRQGQSSVLSLSTYSTNKKSEKALFKQDTNPFDTFTSHPNADLIYNFSPSKIKFHFANSFFCYLIYLNKNS